MKRNEFIFIIACLVLTACLCAGCARTQHTQSDNTNTQNEGIDQDADVDMSENEIMEEVKDSDSSETIIQTVYKPIDYRENALIVQKSEDMELYGLLDNSSNVILEPKYDSLQFTLMNGKDYIKAKLMSDFGILNIDGTECVKMGEYEEIVSAGDIGWLAKQDDKQYLLNEAGQVIKEMKGIYRGCIGNQYLMASYERDVVVKPSMKDGSGDKSYEIFNSDFGDVYDLDENLLISLKSKKIFYLNWLIEGDKFAVYVEGDGIKAKQKLIDTSGNIIAELADDANTRIVGVIMQEHKIILNKGNGNIYEYDLTSGTETATEFTGHTGGVEGWISGIKIEKTGDFYQCYKNGQLLFDERFADYKFWDGVLYLENTDSLWGIVDYDGNIVMPFELGDNKGFYTEILDSDGMFGYYTESNGNYEFHNFIVAKGRKNN